MDYKDIKHQGFMLIISSPSGTGKTTISRMLLVAEENLSMSISATTRTMRTKEKNGIDYFFVSPEKFQQMVDNNEFLEHATVFGQNYGTPRDFVLNRLSEGKDLLFDIDWQGARDLSRHMRDRVVSIFLLPPSMEELRARLNSRGQDTQSIIDDRMMKAASEISHYNEYDYVLINHDLEETLGKIIFIYHAERNKRSRQLGLDEFTKKLLTSDS